MKIEARNIRTTGEKGFPGLEVPQYQPLISAAGTKSQGKGNMSHSGPRETNGYLKTPFLFLSSFFFSLKNTLLMTVVENRILCVSLSLIAVNN